MFRKLGDQLKKLDQKAGAAAYAGDEKKRAAELREKVATEWKLLQDTGMVKPEDRRYETLRRLDTAMHCLTEMLRRRLNNDASIFTTAISRDLPDAPQNYDFKKLQSVVHRDGVPVQVEDLEYTSDITADMDKIFGWVQTTYEEFNKVKLPSWQPTTVKTAAQIAAEKEQARLFMLRTMFLEQNGFSTDPADINKANSSLQTPLSVAVDLNMQQFAEALVAGGANVNQENPNGDIPLHVAARKGHKEITIWLLELGSDTAHTNQAGQTPQQAAKEGFDTITLWLDDRQAEQLAQQTARLAVSA